jgi:hypothetical protein
VGSRVAKGFKVAPQARTCSIEPHPKSSAAASRGARGAFGIQTVPRHQHEGLPFLCREASDGANESVVHLGDLDLGPMGLDGTLGQPTIKRPAAPGAAATVGYVPASSPEEPRHRIFRHLVQPTPGRQECVRDDVVDVIRRDSAGDVAGNGARMNLVERTKSVLSAGIQLSLLTSLLSEGPGLFDRYVSGNSPIVTSERGVTCRGSPGTKAAMPGLVDEGSGRWVSRLCS